MKLLIAYFSAEPHIQELVRALIRGANTVHEIDVIVRKIVSFQEKDDYDTAPDEMDMLENIELAAACRLDDMRNADGILFITPATPDSLVEQTKRLIDSAADLWVNGLLEGKLAGFITAAPYGRGDQNIIMLSSMVILYYIKKVFLVSVPYSGPIILRTGSLETDAFRFMSADSDDEDISIGGRLDLGQILGRQVADLTRKIRM